MRELAASRLRPGLLVWESLPGDPRKGGSWRPGWELGCRLEASCRDAGLRRSAELGELGQLGQAREEAGKPARPEVQLLG